MKKTAREKLHGNKDLPAIKPAPEHWGGGQMVIAHPTEIDALLRKVPKGELVTLDEVRFSLARKHDVDICCPMTAGLFVNITAAAAEEDRSEGRKRITPYWRCLKKKGQLNPKFPGGTQAQQALLEAEGHTVFQKGTKWFVADYENSLSKRL